MPNGYQKWQFTLNNPSDEEKAHLADVLLRPWKHLLQLVCQLEQGESGTPHFQGFCKFAVQRSLRSVKKVLSERAHLEPARGSSWDNYVYCTKSEGRLEQPIVFGEFKRPRSSGGNLFARRAEVIQLIKDNPRITTREILDAGGLEQMVVNDQLVGKTKSILLADCRSGGVTCDIYFGDTGTGKTRLAHSLYSDLFVKPNGNWWDGYQGESVVLLDDFDESTATLPTLLRWIDRYSLRDQVKGSMVQILATHFVITLNDDPRDMFVHAKVPYSQARLSAWRRRVRHILHFTDDGLVRKYSNLYFTSPPLSFLGYVDLPWNQVEVVDQPQLPTSPELFELDPE